MKNLNYKKIILSSLIIFLSIMVKQTFAQANQKESISLNFGPEIIIPEGSFRNTHNTGFGASIKGEYTFGKHVSATVNTGFYAFKGKGYTDDVTVMQKNYNSVLAIPVRVGARYYIGSFYFLGETGVVFLNNYTNSTNALFTVGLGDKIKLGYTKLDISLRQETWINSPRNFNMAVLRVAYEIVWRK
jgi:hypothetical protein